MKPSLRSTIAALAAALLLQGCTVYRVTGNMVVVRKVTLPPPAAAAKCALIAVEQYSHDLDANQGKEIPVDVLREAAKNASMSGLPKG